MKTFPWIFSIVLIITMVQTTGCKKCTCASGGIDIGLINFNSQESDTIIVRSFTKGSSFTLPKDSFQVTAGNSGYYPKNDTLNISLRYRSPGLESANDYEIYFPQTNLTYRLSDFIETPKKLTCLERNRSGCRNMITSVRVNTQIINTLPIVPGEYSLLYIRR